MCESSFLAKTIDQIIGKSTGRGVALLIAISGLAMIAIGIITPRLKNIRALENGKKSITVKISNVL